MTDLSELLVNLGFQGAKTYIQSGNVIFRNHSNKSSSELSADIEKAIKARFGLSISAMTRTIEELNDLFKANPYLEEPDFDPARNAVIFLNKKPAENQINKVAEIDFPPDKYKISGSEIFIYCPNGFGKTKIYSGFFEKKMGVIGTARNWKTITAILALA